MSGIQNLPFPCRERLVIWDRVFSLFVVPCQSLSFFPRVKEVEIYSRPRMTRSFCAGEWSAFSRETSLDSSPVSIFTRELLSYDEPRSEGYDEFFDPPLESKYECPICLFGLREPVQTSCGHRFCRACILRSIRWGRVVTGTFAYAILNFPRTRIFQACLVSQMY